EETPAGATTTPRKHTLENSYFMDSAAPSGPYGSQCGNWGMDLPRLPRPITRVGKGCIGFHGRQFGYWDRRYTDKKGVFCNQGFDGEISTVFYVPSLMSFMLIRSFLRKYVPLPISDGTPYPLVWSTGDLPAFVPANTGRWYDNNQYVWRLRNPLA